MADSTNSQIGSKGELNYWNALGSPDPGYEPMGFVRSIQGIGVTKPEVESTTLDDDAVRRIGGLKDGKEVTIVLTLNAETLAKVEGFLDANEEIELQYRIAAPTSQDRYFAFFPLDYDHGTIAASTLMELTLKGRISGPISAIDPHGDSSPA